MAAANKSVKEDIRKFIIGNYFVDASGDGLLDDDSFLKKGIIDSIGVIELTQFIQQKYGINIQVKEIIPENFDTVNNLERYVNRKLDKHAG